MMACLCQQVIKFVLHKIKKIKTNVLKSSKIYYSNIKKNGQIQWKKSDHFQSLIFVPIKSHSYLIK